MADKRIEEEFKKFVKEMRDTASDYQDGNPDNGHQKVLEIIFDLIQSDRGVAIIEFYKDDDGCMLSRMNANAPKEMNHRDLIGVLMSSAAEVALDVAGTPDILRPYLREHAFDMAVETAREWNIEHSDKGD